VGAATYSISDSAAAITTAFTTGNGGLTAVQNAVTVDATDNAGLATLTLTDAQFGNLLTGTSLLAADDTITVNGAGNTGWVLDNFGGNETLVLSSAGPYFVGMGTSGTTTLHLGGTGNHTIGADDAGALAETFILDAAQNGGSTITGLTAGDMIDIDGANAIAALVAGVSGAGTTGVGGVAGVVDVATEWSFASSTLTYWNDVANAAHTLTLTGTIGSLTMAGGDTFTVG